MQKYRLLKLILLLLPLFGMLSAPVYADKKGHDGHYRKGYRLDNRYQHNHYYPSHGYRFKSLPHRHYEIEFHRRPYYYSSGIWYLRSGARFVVTVPPVGIVVPFLPPSTLLFG